MRPDGNTGTPLRVVVSGGIGSGKSTVLRLFEMNGAMVIEADKVGHQVLEPGGACFNRVADRWPSVVVQGRIDRARLAAIVFGDAEQLAELEAITHPAIREQISALVADAVDRDIVLESPLRSDLLGSGWIRVVVDTPDQLRQKRAISRGMEPADVDRRMGNQPNRQDWIDGADLVIDNSGTLEDLEQAAVAVWSRLRGEGGLW